MNDEANINYMASVDEHGETAFLEKLSKFDPKTANNYKRMFEVGIQKAVQKERRASLKLGKQEGRQEGRQEVARQMIMEGESLNKVSKYTGLPLDELKGLERKS